MPNAEDEVAALQAERWSVRSCRAGDVLGLATLLAESFADDPAYQYLVSEPTQLRAGLSRFFAGNLRVHLDHHCTHVLMDGKGAALATVTLRPPGGVHGSTSTMLRKGVIPFAWHHGLGAVRRLLWLKETYDALEAQIAQGRPHLYVHMMAVRSDAQGRGLGSRLLREVLAEAQRRHPDAPTVLTTHQSSNVIYYRKLGFDVTDECEVHPPGAESFRVWSMCRRSQPPELVAAV